MFRTDRDIEDLGDINARIRLCIGIYREPKEIAYTNKKLMKERLIAFAQELISKNHYVAFATHDEKYIKRMLTIVDEKKLTNEQIEFQMLLGVPRRKIQREIIERGFTMRLYVPFAEEKKYSIAYLRRRLYENPFMS